MGFIKPILTLAGLKAKYKPPDWEKQLPASKRPDFLSADEFRQYVQVVSEDNAFEFYKFLLNNIMTNRYKFKLAASTIQMKGSAIPWVDTKELINHIIFKKDEVKMAKGKHSKSKLTYETLAMILEYGQKERGIPPRDVFRRSFDEFKETMITNVLDSF